LGFIYWFFLTKTPKPAYNGIGSAPVVFGRSYTRWFPSGLAVNSEALEKENLHMNSRHAIIIALAGALLFLHGCGGGEVEQLKTQQTDSERNITGLKSELETARDALSRQEVQNQRLNREVETLRAEIAKMEEAAAKAQAEKKEPAPKEPVDQSKLSLMGAKALAEHKAVRLTERLDRLGRDLDRKNKNLRKSGKPLTKRIVRSLHCAARSKSSSEAIKHEPPKWTRNLHSSPKKARSGPPKLNV